MGIYEELKAQGSIAQVTDEAEIRELIDARKAKSYIGFDPTMDPLYVRHFIALCLVKRPQMAGNRPVVLLGEGAGYVGDPSGRTDMYFMVGPDVIRRNCEYLKRQMERFIDFDGESGAIVVNNMDWLLNLNHIELLRDVGACFSINNTLRVERCKRGMEKGLSFLEFNYMTMQSYDFYHLYKELGYSMQFGGDDQQSNILGGTELIRRKLGKGAYITTTTLLMNSEGNKIGKTARDAVWLDSKKTSPFEFYQYWRNIVNADVMECIHILTFIPVEKIDAMDGWEGAQLNRVEEILAYDLTALVHGEEEAHRAKETPVFPLTGAMDDNNILFIEVEGERPVQGSTSIMDPLVPCRLAASKNEARRLIAQDGIQVSQKKVESIDFTVARNTLMDGIIIQKGKEVFRKAGLRQ